MQINFNSHVIVYNYVDSKLLFLALHTWELLNNIPLLQIKHGNCNWNPGLQLTLRGNGNRIHTYWILIIKSSGYYNIGLGCCNVKFNIFLSSFWYYCWILLYYKIIRCVRYCGLKILLGYLARVESLIMPSSNLKKIIKWNRNCWKATDKLNQWITNTNITRSNFDFYFFLYHEKNKTFC